MFISASIIIPSTLEILLRAISLDFSLSWPAKKFNQITYIEKLKTEKPSEAWNTLYNSVHSAYPIGLEWWKNPFKMLDEHISAPEMIINSRAIGFNPIFLCILFISKNF